MTNDVLSSALIQSMARNFSVAELIRTAETLKQSGQLNSVETLYATWIEHNQDNSLLYAILFNYSVTLTDAGKLVPARECLERAVAINPEFMPAYINLGRVYERVGMATLAVVQGTCRRCLMRRRTASTTEPLTYFGVSGSTPCSASSSRISRMR